LERIAKDSPKDQAAIVEILSAFVRKNSPVKYEIHPKSKKVILKNSPVTITIQAVLTVIGRRKRLDDKVFKDFIDLNGANLSHAFLDEANLYKANLIDANLNEAILLEVTNFTPEQIKTACNWNSTEYSSPVEINKMKQARTSYPTTGCSSNWKSKN
jgi:hypothetical protein